MKKFLRGSEGIGMVMVLAFMGLAVPLITSSLALAGTLSIDSQVKSRTASEQYAAVGVLEYVHYLLRDPQEWQAWRIDNGDQDSITVNGQEITFTVSGGEAVEITIDSIWQDEWVGSPADGSGIGADTALIRSQRSSSGDGRVYHISFTATPTETITVCSAAFSSPTGCEVVPAPSQGALVCNNATPSIETIWSPTGEMVPVTVLGVDSAYQCTGEVLVGVSHDGSTPSTDGGPLYNSTEAQSN